MAAESVSKKRRNSHPETEGNDMKRRKIDLVSHPNEVTSSENVYENSVVKHKKHKLIKDSHGDNSGNTRRHTIEPAELPSISTVEEEQEVTCSSHKKKKKKHRQSLSDDCVDMLEKTDADLCGNNSLLSKSTVQPCETNSHLQNGESELHDLHAHRKKHKKHGHEASTHEVPSVKSGFVNVTSNSPVVGSSADCASPVVSKRKKKKRHQEDEIMPEDNKNEVTFMQPECCGHSGKQKSISHVESTHRISLQGSQAESNRKSKKSVSDVDSDDSGSIHATSQSIGKS